MTATQSTRHHPLMLLPVDDEPMGRGAHIVSVLSLSVLTRQQG